ncbi:hypothetical protein AB1L42_21845 [Thalassoglobus sp. JC818]|uniref:hypothetical protein n=1 Tax=Thalassoglobus sp. JC818 TaxID=3232136 RepID=UPI00345A64E9
MANNKTNHEVNTINSPFAYQFNGMVGNLEPKKSVQDATQRQAELAKVSDAQVFGEAYDRKILKPSELGDYEFDQLRTVREIPLSEWSDAQVSREAKKKRGL